MTEDDENIADRGKWRQVIFARNGKPLPNFVKAMAGGEGEGGVGGQPPTAFRETARVLAAIQEDAAKELPKGSMEFR